MLHTPVPEPRSCPRHARGAHQQRRRRLVAAHQQHDAVDRIAANALFDVHAREVAIEHRGRPQQRLAERHDRKLERKAAGFPDAGLHVLGKRAEVRIARRQLAVGVADADHRPAVELVVRQPAALQPAAIVEAVAVLSAEPLLAAQSFGLLRFGVGCHGIASRKLKAFIIR
jgi:hypothetical protein